MAADVFLQISLQKHTNYFMLLDFDLYHSRDRTLIFYFERGRDSGVKATSVFRLARARRSRARQSPKDPMIGHQAIGVDVTRNR